MTEAEKYVECMRAQLAEVRARIERRDVEFERLRGALEKRREDIDARIAELDRVSPLRGVL